MCNTVKLGNKELFDKEQIGTYEGTISSDQFAIYLIRIRNNFRATKKFLIAKFDCDCECVVSFTILNYITKILWTFSGKMKL